MHRNVRMGAIQVDNVMTKQETSGIQGSYDVGMAREVTRTRCQQTIIRKRSSVPLLEVGLRGLLLSS